jgi:lipopolysaccharide/colanic/teichoic acid biosynthesis glycosyltransferase
MGAAVDARTVESPEYCDKVSEVRAVSAMGKRALDLLVASAGLILLSPIIVMLGIWIKIDSPGPVFFRQERVGRGGVPFHILKFRTLRVQAEEKGRLTIGADPRVTRAGRFLRKHKFDELPQLVNVVLGHMSLVGPRPELREYFELYPPDAIRAMLSLRPGITAPGLLMLFDESEILGRSADPHQTYISELIPIKARCAVQYATRNSTLGDLRLILFTIRKVVESFVR